MMDKIERMGDKQQVQQGRSAEGQRTRDGKIVEEIYRNWEDGEYASRLGGGEQ